MSDTMTIPTVQVELKPGVSIPLGKDKRLWRVLEVDREHDRALLIAERPVCNRQYHSKWEDITWEHCDLRAWLNGEYFDTAFSEEEKAAIAETHLSNPDNPKYNTPGGNDTSDRIFLLSIDEAEKYFKDDTAPRAAGGGCARPAAAAATRLTSTMTAASTSTATAWTSAAVCGPLLESILNPTSSHLSSSPNLKNLSSSPSRN